MFKNISTVLIWSEDFRELADWYIEKLDLQHVKELDHPKDTGVLFRIGNTNLWIGQHSEVHGKNIDIHRHMFNIDVDSVNATYEYLKSKGVNFLAIPFKAPTMDRYFATFYDLDNNLIQLIGEK
ncbi:MAG: VOC family protein [Candidatus Levybacteria bacterium]|nr:VOC family protein [Candidatus Levybacteria bacterium]